TERQQVPGGVADIFGVAAGLAARAGDQPHLLAEIEPAGELRVGFVDEIGEGFDPGAGRQGHAAPGFTIDAAILFAGLKIIERFGPDASIDLEGHAEATAAAAQAEDEARPLGRAAMAVRIDR